MEDIEESLAHTERAEFRKFGGSRGAGSRDCALCGILFDVKDVILESSVKTLHLSSTAVGLRNDGDVTIRSTMRWKAYGSGIWQEFAVSKAGYCPMYRPRILNAKSIDIKIVRGWLRKCSQRCHNPGHSSHSVTHLRVIDCASKQIVKAPDECSYVALSYVWGESQSALSGASQGKFPRTIADSITFSLALGFKYLWVDFYVCGTDGVVTPLSKLTQL